MYLVTGGGGFIGSHLVRGLVQRGKRVRVIENGYSGTRDRIRDVLDDVEWVNGDIRDEGLLAKICQGVEVILHHAAIASVPASVADPMLSHAVNVNGTLNVLRAAQNAGVRRVVFASSSALYGEEPTTPKHEFLPTRPISPYGAQKLAAEAYCRVWSQVYGLETVALRYFNVFGPSQDPKSEYAAVIPRFITAALSDRPPTIYGDGEQSRDFMYVKNVVDINLLVAVHPAAIGATLNVGTGSSLTLNHLVSTIGEKIGKMITPNYAPSRPGDIRESLADIHLLRETVQYEPAYSFEDGLAETIAAYQL